MHLNPSSLGSVVLNLMFIVAPIVGVLGFSLFCYVLICVLSSVAIILVGKRKLVALL